MKLILFDLPSPNRVHFYPIALSRPIWELRCGMTSLEDKLTRCIGTRPDGYFVPPYMEDAFRERATAPVNDLSLLDGDDLLLVNARIKAAEFDLDSIENREVGLAGDEVTYIRVPRNDLAKLNLETITDAIASARQELPNASRQVPCWNYIWDLIIENPDEITRDFQMEKKSGIDGLVEEPSAIRGGASDIYIAPGASIHPMVVLDASNGPVYIDEQVEIHPFSRIEGPCYIGKKSIVLGAKCREGNSIGPVCRIGGEIEESIIQGYSNKYHDGFLGHAYVGEWVNLGALTTNSDLKNDYTTVEVTLDGGLHFDTGSTKIGSLIGDHTKTSIGTLLNTGSYIGAMCLILTDGKPLPKFLPSFSWFLNGVISKGFGKNKLYATAETAMGRRQKAWTAAQLSMWNEIFKETAPDRINEVKKGRRALAARTRK
jgi:UDP-N-acetylglucosamine diphosphorylase / glucose-1-phosphate thymidylyltransferase / UDP-N-acetylgalactosamine diphosphorylase / glucosamine-1-phosphate N-acetyltransferase / galactosamine-1-phosphate N-acetyltransferase